VGVQYGRCHVERGVWGGGVRRSVCRWQPTDSGPEPVGADSIGRCAPRAAWLLETGERVTDRWGLEHSTSVQTNEIQTILNKIQIHPSFDRSKRDLPMLENFQIKYKIEGFEERNNFLHINFFRFEIDFK
jgi:hypothetical protein